MSATEWLLLISAAVAAGAVNAVAGGGSLISFPAMLAVGVSPVTASATNTIALTPGGIAAAVAYRRELRHGKRFLLLALPAALGSLIGATLLLAVPERFFELIVPWLVLGATALLVVKDTLWRRAATASAPASAGRIGLVGLGLAVTAVYGGYFGAGIGIVTLALLALLEHMSIHQMNALKAVIVAAINGVAAGYFLLRDAANLPVALVMAVGAVAGGFSGAALARRANPNVVRWIVVVIGIALSVGLAYRAFR